MSHLFRFHDSRTDRWTWLATWVLAVMLAGCQQQPSDAPHVWIGQTLRPAVSVADARLPPTLGGYALQGEIAGERDTVRVALYGNGQESVRISLYPLPGGWEDFDYSRRVASQYLQTRQDFVDRLQRRGAQQVVLLSEASKTNEKTGMVMTSSTLQASPWIKNGRTQFVLSSSEHYLIQLNQDGSKELDQLTRLEVLMEELIAHLDQARA